MIELIFSDGGAAALGIAKKTGDKSALCDVEIITDGNHETMNEVAPKPYSGPMVDGDFSDIAAAWLMGDVGDLSGLPDWASRLNLIQDIAAIHEMDSDEWVAAEKTHAAALIDRLQAAVRSGEPVRIWWSDVAHETCGYYWAVHLLKDATGIVSSIKVPRLWPHPDGYRIVNGTGELEPQDCHSLLHLERQINQEERSVLAAHWETLVSENAPLRVVINGIPCSAAEDFYDYVLHQTFPDRNFKIVQALGLALVKGPGGVSDWWYAWRIRHLIDCGKLEIVEHSDKFYYTTVRKANP